MRAFQGRIVDNLIAAKKARHSDLTTQDSFYVEICRACDHAKLVIREHLVSHDRQPLRRDQGHATRASAVDEPAPAEIQDSDVCAVVARLRTETVSARPVSEICGAPHGGTGAGSKGPSARSRSLAVKPVPEAGGRTASSLVRGARRSDPRRDRARPTVPLLSADRRDPALRLRSVPVRPPDIVGERRVRVGAKPAPRHRSGASAALRHSSDP